MMPEFIHIAPEQMKSEFIKILKKHGFSEAKAEACAEIFTVNSMEGVYTHGVNRFPRFVRYVIDHYIDPDAVPTLVARTGSLEQWNGNLGPGPLNAVFATDRVMALSDENGIGMVTLANTNHWMRGGTYGWKAARLGYVFIGWTNTIANMPGWGAKDVRLGNNPFVLAVPFGDDAIVLDFAMSQYSYGKMEAFHSEGKQLPFPGGFNTKSELTTNAGEILETWRALPIGYWKGAGFSLLLDILAAVLSGGSPTHEITKRNVEYGVSQVFIAISLKKLHNLPSIENTVRTVISDLHDSVPVDESTVIRYPGENVKKIREKAAQSGIPVNKFLWDEIISL